MSVDKKQTKVVKTDAHLQRDVLDELAWEPRISAAEIGVTVHEGIITLTGHVPVYAKKHAAELAAKRVHGVRAVANELEVRPSDVHLRDDEDLAAAAIHALEWDALVPLEDLKVTVESGWIKIEGSVDRQFEKAAVERAVRHLSGVRGVTNEVQVTPPEAISEIQNGIQAAFQRNALLNARDIVVEVDGTTVILTGDAHSHSELEEAQRIAWTAPGVQKVENCITLTPWGFGPAEEWGY